MDGRFNFAVDLRHREMVNEVATDGFSGDVFAVNTQDAVKLLENERLHLIKQIQTMMDEASVSQFVTSGECNSYRLACLDVIDLIQSGNL